jgi:betaine lipid synthase
MASFVDVPQFFSAVYLVDFSPSLCEVARKRFARLGWSNVKVVCEDARKFSLDDYENHAQLAPAPTRAPRSYFSQRRPEHGGADLVTMSYSLSMIVRECPRQNLVTNQCGMSLA